MHINSDELRKFVEDNPKLVTRKESKRHPGLYVLKYGRKVFYDNLWHESWFLLYCRGLVVDADYNVVVEPFLKVFNHNENGTNIDRDEPCQIVRKVNGFLGVVTKDSKYADKLIYSTTGSLDSDFVDLIAKHVDPFSQNLIDYFDRIGVPKWTLMFEICDETDPHIVPERQGAWLIGANLYDDIPVSQDRMDFFTTHFNIGGHEVMRPEHFEVARFSDVVTLANQCEHEGYMVYGFRSGTALKIKSPYYLVTKFLARAGESKLNTILSGDVKKSRQSFDEEFYPLIDHLVTIGDEFKAMEEQQRIAVIREFLRNK